HALGRRDQVDRADLVVLAPATPVAAILDVRAHLGVGGQRLLGHRFLRAGGIFGHRGSYHTTNAPTTSVETQAKVGPDRRSSPASPAPSLPSPEPRLPGEDVFHVTRPISARLDRPRSTGPLSRPWPTANRLSRCA